MTTWAPASILGRDAGSGPRQSRLARPLICPHAVPVNIKIIVALALISLSLNGCQRSPSAPPTTASPQLNRGQTDLPRITLRLGNLEIESEVCVTDLQVASGLMARAGIGPDETMLFVFRAPDRRAFYMKNVGFPIALAYIEPDGTIAEIVPMQAFDTQPVPSRANNIQFVLEAAPDFFDRHGFVPGTLITTPQGSLQAVMARR
jgi:uncharacterized protein